MRLVLPSLLLALAACSSGKPAADPNAERDGAAAAALNDPIMVDPDLSAQNRGNSALSGGGPPEGDLPDFNRSPEEADAARSAAQAALGGNVQPAPSATSTAPKSRLDGALTMPAVAAASGIASKACTDGMGFTFGWAAQLPAGLQVYPRGHTTVASGNDTHGCKVRAVRFVTPVAVSDAVDFYFAAGRAAKLDPQRRREGDDEVVAGKSASGATAAYVRKRADGLTEVDLISSGL
ncbi:MAG: hypothetical protein ACKOOL_00375 [Novosphingobium sp.]